jgi:hypothetical protein
MFAFGHVITIKHWQSTPPKKDKPKKLQTQTQTLGLSDNMLAERATPLVYQFTPIPSTLPNVPTDLLASFERTRKAAEEARQECRRGPLRK